MEQTRLFKIAGERFTELLDRVGLMGSRLEDLLFRAQRISTAVKNKQKHRDILFSEDLQLMRRNVRTLSQDSSSLPGLMDWLERESHYEEDQMTLLNHARSLLTVATTLQKALANLQDQSRMLHQYIPETDQKIEAWYMVQDLEILGQKALTYPFTISSRIMNKITTPGV